MNRCVKSFGSVVVLLSLSVLREAVPCLIPIIEPIPPPMPTPIPVERVVVNPLTTRLHRADIQIKDQVARVRLTAEFYNPNPMRLEGTYVFPLDTEASVSAFSMTVNGKESKAELLPADKARNIYEDIVRRQQDPGLLEYFGTKLLKARVFPIEPNQSVKIDLQYEQTVREDGGVCHLRYPLRSAKPPEGAIDQVSVNVSIESSIPLKNVYSPSYSVDIVKSKDTAAKMSFEATKAVPERDLDIYFLRAAGDLGVSLLSHKPAKEDGYFLLGVSPKVDLAAEQVQKKNLIFVLDTSGSMVGEKIDQARNALSFCVNSLNPGDRFNVVTFSTEARSFKPSLTAVEKTSVEEAREFIKGIQARGGTAIDEALSMALKMASEEKGLTMILFLTDGRPTIGELNIDSILANARKLNAANSRVFVFGVGYDVNTDLLDKLAEENRGANEYVMEKEDLEVKVSAFFNKVANPVLSNVKFAFEGMDIYDMYPKAIPEIFRGSQVVAFGRYKKPGTGTLKLSGSLNDQAKEFTYPLSFGEKETNEFIPRLWATRKVAYLLNQIRLHGKNQELVDEVVALGKQYGIVTPYTSFLIVEDGVPAPIRDQVGAALRTFEGEHTGADAVLQSRAIEALGAADNLADAPAGIGVGAVTGGGQAGGGEAAIAVEKLVRTKVCQVADKTFYLKPDGFLYDSLFREEDQAKITDVEFLSQGYFELLRAHPTLGRYLAAGKNLVLCFQGKIYRVRAK